MKKPRVETTNTDYCKCGDCRYTVTRNGERVIPTENFSCKNGFINPQYPVYICCQLLKFKEGKDACLCQPFRDARRQIAYDNGIREMPKYVEILKQMSAAVPLEQTR
jgi:hypothetical protein